MTYKDVNSQSLSVSRSIAGQYGNRPAMESNRQNRDRLNYLFCLIGFAVPAILVWLFIVLFAWKTKIYAVLLIMVGAGIVGATFVGLLQRARELKHFPVDKPRGR